VLVLTSNLNFIRIIIYVFKEAFWKTAILINRHKAQGKSRVWVCSNDWLGMVSISLCDIVKQNSS
jgi:hypothetical protein